MDPWAGLSERTLVERARRGDHDAFAALVDSRLPATFRTVLAILGNESDARDTTQTIFVQAWRHLPSLRDPELFAASFGRIVVNTARTSSCDTVDDNAFGRSRSRVCPTKANPSRPDRRLMKTGRRRTTGWSGRSSGFPTASERACGSTTRGTVAGGSASGFQVSSKTVKSRMFTARRALERELTTEDRPR